METKINLITAEMQQNYQSLVDEDNDDYSRPVMVSYVKTLKNTFGFTGYIILTRLAIVINNIGNGIIIAQLGKDAVEAGSLITTFQYITSGTIISFLMSSGAIIGELNGSQEIIQNRLVRLSKENELGENEQKLIRQKEKILESISNASKQSLIMGTVLSLPALAVLLSVRKILTAIGTREPVAETVQSFFYPFAMGMTVTFWIVSDQQFALGIGRKSVSLGVGISHIFFSMLIGYPLALGSFGLPKLGVDGIAYGVTLSSFLNIIALRLYFFLDKSLAKYELFKVKYAGLFENFTQMIKKAFFMGLYGFVNWGNLFAISLLSSTFNKDILAAEQTSYQLLVSFSLVLVGMAQANVILISDVIGNLKTTVRSGDMKLAQIYKQNAKNIFKAEITFGLILSAMTCGLGIGLSRSLTDLFAGDQAENDNVMALSQKMVLINGISLLAESVRGIGAGALNAIDNNIFAPFISFLTLILVGLPLDYIFTYILDWEASSLFIARDVGIFFAMLAIIYRWMIGIEVIDSQFIVNENIDVPVLHEIKDTNKADASRQKLIDFNESVNSDNEKDHFSEDNQSGFFYQSIQKTDSKQKFISHAINDSSGSKSPLIKKNKLG